MAFGAITNIGTPSGGSSGTTQAITVATAPTAPTLPGIVVGVSIRDASGGVTSNPVCTDSRSNTYTRIWVATDSGVTEGALFYCSGATPLENGDSITISGLADGRARIMAAGYVERMGTLFGSASAAQATGTGDTAASGNVASMPNPSVAIGMVGWSNQSPADTFITLATPDADYSSDLTGGATSLGSGNGIDRAIYIGNRVISSLTTDGFTNVFNTACVWTSILAVFNEAVDPGITGTGDITLDDAVAAGTGTASESGTGITGTGAVTLDGVVAAATGQTAFFYDDFDTSCVDVAASTITGVGDAAVFSAGTRPILSEAASASARWLQSVFEIRGGIGGLRPIIELQSHATWHGNISGVAWQSTRRLWSREWNGGSWGAWAVFGEAPTVATGIRYQDGAAFGATTSRVQIATTIPYSAAEDEAWLAGLAVSHPNVVKNAPSNVDGFRSILAASQTDELGRTVPATYIHSVWLDDDDKPSPSGAKGLFQLNAGVHPGEWQGKRMQRAKVAWLLSDTVKSNFLRTHLIFAVRPSLQPIGGAGGHWRGDWQIAPGLSPQTVDLNRRATTTGTSIDCVNNYQDLNTADYAGRQVVVGQCDDHGDFGIGGHTKMVAAYNIDEIATTDAFRDRFEVYLGAGSINDLGPSSNDSVTKSYRDVWGSSFSMAFEIAEQAPRSDADFAAAADAWGQALYDMLRAGDWHFNVGTGAATLDGVTAAGAGTATGPILGAPQAGGALVNVNRLMNR